MKNLETVWSASELIGSGLAYTVMGILVVFMILIIIIFNKHQLKGRIYIAVIHYTSDEAGDNVIRAFGKMKYFIKSKTVRKGVVEMAVEVYCKNNDTFILEKIRAVEGVEDVTLIQYNGEYHG